MPNVLDSLMWRMKRISGTRGSHKCCSFRKLVYHICTGTTCKRRCKGIIFKSVFANIFFENTAWISQWKHRKKWRKIFSSTSIGFQRFWIIYLVLLLLIFFLKKYFNFCLMYCFWGYSARLVSCYIPASKNHITSNATRLWTQTNRPLSFEISTPIYLFFSSQLPSCFSLYWGIPKILFVRHSQFFCAAL